MMAQHRRIPCANTCLLLLVAALLALASSTSSSMFAAAFSPGMPSDKGASKAPPAGKTEGAPPAAAAAAAAPAATATAAPAAAATAPSGAVPKQSDYGQALELPKTYASCGQCGAAFALTLEAMGPGKGGRRMECSVCSHTWFQSRDRLATLGDGFEMTTLPERDLERIQLNIKEGRHPKWFGDFKMYVGNISFQCTEADLFELFESIGPVGDVSMVRDETGRPRGFGFITMRSKEDGEKALEELDGVDLKGRNLNVRPSTN